MSTADPCSVELPHEAFVVAMSALEGVGPSRLRWLLGFGAPSVVWEKLRAGALPAERRASVAVDRALLENWRKASGQVTPAQWWQRCCQAGVGVATIGSPAYPPWLVDDIDPPVVLFHRGDPDRVSTMRVGIVGTRRATGYGRRHASTIAGELTEAGVSVVSGLALGVDAAAHRGAVGAAKGGAVASWGAPVAIVGAGLDSPCPRQNAALAADVAEHGVLLSEVPPGVRGAPWRFPVRNRVIAAACNALLVVESAANGGSMHTVREALRRDRTVLALPGPVDSAVSVGTNGLLTDGALVCNGTEDVLAALGHVRAVKRDGDDGLPQQRMDLDQSDLERRVRPRDRRARQALDELGWRPMTVDALAEAAGLGVMELAVALVELERAGWIARHGSWVERVAGRGRSPSRGR